MDCAYGWRCTRGAPTSARLTSDAKIAKLAAEGAGWSEDQAADEALKV
jgi:hypothetical protein